MIRNKGNRIVLVVLYFLLSLFAYGQNDSNSVEKVTLLFTNDFESAYDPTEAFWRDDIRYIGGVAQLATLIDSLRATEPNVFLFDSGDIFTGTLAKLTNGALSFELMMTMGYDAMAIGNHEFEYGWEEFAQQKNRVAFPVLGANLFYKGTSIPFAQPYTILERNGIRIGVIGILGQDAATALIPSNIAGVEVTDPKITVQKAVNLLRPDVDLIVLLTHQGKTAPMQTDDEDPSVKRDINADITLAGDVTGVDVLLGGHADAGTEKPVVHPETGTIIMQTYGQGFHLGFLQLTVDVNEDKLLNHKGYLIPVNSDELEPHRLVAAKLAGYRDRFPKIYEMVGQTEARLNRQYNSESDLGNLFADILCKETEKPIGLMPSGALRKDLPRGAITREELLDAFPFNDRVVTLRITGQTLLKILEQSLSLERGILQVSGLRVHYNISQPIGERVKKVKVGKKKLDPIAIYEVATIEILAQGGDMYKAFLEAEATDEPGPIFSKVLENYFKQAGPVRIPKRGRLINQMD